MQVDTQGYEYAGALAAWGKDAWDVDDMGEGWGRSLRQGRIVSVWVGAFAKDVVA